MSKVTIDEVRKDNIKERGKYFFRDKEITKIYSES